MKKEIAFLNKLKKNEKDYYRENLFDLPEYKIEFLRDNIVFANPIPVQPRRGMEELIPVVRTWQAAVPGNWMAIDEALEPNVAEEEENDREDDEIPF